MFDFVESKLKMANCKSEFFKKLMRKIIKYKKIEKRPEKFVGFFEKKSIKSAVVGLARILFLSIRIIILFSFRYQNICSIVFDFYVSLLFLIIILILFSEFSVNY